MKRLIVSSLVFVLILCSGLVFAQIGHGGEPLSFQKANVLSNKVEHIQLAKPDMAIIEAEDAMFQKNGELYKVGRMLDVNVDINTAGTWDFLDDGTKVWRLGISAQDAKALAVYYDKFHLTPGSRLFLYNQNRKQVIGSFDHRNNSRFGDKFSTQIIEGETTWLELIIDANASEMPVLEIAKVSYLYRGVELLISKFSDAKNPGFGVSENCHVNVNCPEGASWQEQKRGVAEILLSDTWFSGFCSGSLINNAENDGTPYFLSVAHCADGSNYFQQWQFYFNYEAQSCWNPEVAPDYNTIVGASMKAIGSDVTGSDFLLLELNTTEDELEAINAYYNGWDISGDASPSGVGIHHPSGDIKKISTYTGVLSTSSYPTSSAVDAFWRVNWSATQTDYGVTEAGSNGSPLFNNNKLIVGTLTGGASACFAPEQNQFDLYGKMDYHWESNSKSNSGQLKSWLDPQNTGITVLQGREPNSEIQYLIAQFVGSPTTVEIGDTVDFTDQSDSNPTSWLWLFEGGTPDTSTTQNPSVVYDTPGTYDVSLTVSNQYGDDTEVKTGYITVNDYNKVSETEVFQSQINVFPNPNSGEFSIDLGDFDSEVQIRITNINGQELKAKTTKTGKYINVNTDNIPSGLYFLQVITEDFSKVYKITIAK